MTRYGLIIAILIAVSCAGSTSAAERDPFAPYITTDDKAATRPAERTVSADNHGLVTGALSSYKLIGVIVAKEKSFAVLRNGDMQDFFLQVGDTLGSEQGVVKEISVDNVLVEINGREEILPVKNRMDEPVDGKVTK